MNKINLRDLPATRIYMGNFVQEVFGPIFIGQCNAIYVVPKFGCNSFIKYTLRFPEQIKGGLKSKINKNTWIRVELNGIEREEEFWEAVVSQLNQKSKKISNPKTYAIKEIQKMADANNNIVFIFNSASIYT